MTDPLIRTLHDREELEVSGVSWGHQVLGNRDRYKGDRLYDEPFLYGDVYVIDGQRKPPRTPVQVGETVRIEGRPGELYVIEAPGRMDGDNCKLTRKEAEDAPCDVCGKASCPGDCYLYGNPGGPDPSGYREAY